MVDLDLEKFFDRVNHDMLTARVARRVLKLVRRFREAGIMRDGVCVERHQYYDTVITKHNVGPVSCRRPEG